MQEDNGIHWEGRGFGKSYTLPIIMGIGRTHGLATAHLPMPDRAMAIASAIATASVIPHHLTMCHASTLPKMRSCGASTGKSFLVLDDLQYITNKSMHYADSSDGYNSEREIFKSKKRILDKVEVERYNRMIGYLTIAKTQNKEK